MKRIGAEDIRDGRHYHVVEGEGDVFLVRVISDMNSHRKTFLCSALNHQTGRFQTRDFIAAKCHFFQLEAAEVAEMKDLIKRKFGKLGIESVNYFDSACARIDNDSKKAQKDGGPWR